MISYDFSIKVCIIDRVLREANLKKVARKVQAKTEARADCKGTETGYNS